MKSLFKKMVKSTIVTNREKKAAATAAPPPTESQKAKKAAEDDKPKKKQQAKAAAPAVEAAQSEALPDLAENNDALDGASYSKDDGKDLVTLEDEYVAALNENRHLEEERALLLQLLAVSSLDEQRLEAEVHDRHQPTRVRAAESQIKQHRHHCHYAGLARFV